MSKQHRVWSLQEAKAKFSEVVRLAQADGPQTVTVHGKPAVVISAADGSHPVKQKLTGHDFYEALSAGPSLDNEIPERPKHGPFREIDIE
jgi:prevent-host-death family protein